MNRIVDVLKLFKKLGALEINDAIGTVFGKKPGLGNIYVALHRLERAKIIQSQWDERSDGIRRKYCQLAEIAPWELVKQDQNKMPHNEQ